MARAHNALSEKQLSIIVAGLKNGDTARSIAESVGCSVNTIYAYRKKLNYFGSEHSKRCTKRLTLEEETRIANQLVDTKDSFRKIARICGTTPRTVQRVARTIDPEKLPVRSPNAVDPAKRQLAEELLRDGHTVIEIVRQTGLERNTIKYYADKLGITPPKFFDAVNRRIDDLIELGWTTADISRFAEVSCERVRTKRNGRRPHIRVLSIDERSRVKEMAGKGDNEYHIALELHLNPRQVRSAIYKKPRKPKKRKKATVPKVSHRNRPKIRHGYFEADGHKVLVPSPGEWQTRIAAQGLKPSSKNALNVYMRDKRCQLECEFTSVNHFLNRYPELEWYETWLMGGDAPNDVAIVSQAQSKRLNIAFDYMGILREIGVSDGSFRELLARFDRERFAQFVTFLYGGSAPHGVYIPPAEVTDLRYRLSLNGQLKYSCVTRSEYESWQTEPLIRRILADSTKLPLHILTRTKAWAELTLNMQPIRVEALLRFLTRATRRSALSDVCKSPGFYENVRRNAARNNCLNELDSFLESGGEPGSQRLGFYQDGGGLFIAPKWVWEFRTEACSRFGNGEVARIRNDVGDNIFRKILLAFAVPKSKRPAADVISSNAPVGYCQSGCAPDTEPMPSVCNVSHARDVPNDRKLVELSAPDLHGLSMKVVESVDSQSREKTTDHAHHTNGFSMAELRAKFDCSDSKTIRPFIEAANVEPPRRGEKNWRCTRNDAIAIAREIRSNGLSGSIRNRASKFFEELLSDNRNLI